MKQNVIDYTKYYIIYNEPTVAFTSKYDAYKWDIDNNPDMHITKDHSFARYNNLIEEVVYSKLNQTQREFLDNQTTDYFD